MAMSHQRTDDNGFSEISSLPSKSLFSAKVAGPISCITVTPSELGTLAIDCTDSILLRDCSSLVPLKCFGPLKQCVSYIEWHPTKPNIIAFGSISGKVGFIEIDRHANQSPSYFEEDHRITVYSLAWGPCSKLSGWNEVDQDHMFLYSCGGGKILIHNINKLNESFSVEDIIGESSNAPYYTEFTWKPDFSQFAIGCKDGSLSIYDKDTCNILFKLKDVKGGIWTTRWHPKFMLPDSATRSKYHNVIAVGTPEDIVHIYIIKAKKGKVDGGTDMKPTKLLKGHNGPINKLDWSPFIEGRLATCSKDASVQIWDVNKGDLIANFQGHERNVLTVRWSLADPDIVFSAGRDHRLICWRPSEQTETHPPERLPMLDRRRRKGGSTFKDLDDPVVFSSKKELLERVAFGKNKQGEVTKDKSVFTMKSASSEATDGFKETTKERRQMRNERKVNKVLEVRTVPVDTSGIDDQIIEDVLKEFEELSNGDKPFTDDVLEEMEEKKCFFDENPLNVLAHFFPDEDLYKIFYAARSFKKILDPFYVAIAPKVSMCNWKKSCIACSKANFESSRNDVAALYTLIVGDIAATVSILLKDNVHRVMECYFIAKYYCEKKDPLIQEYWELLHQDLHYRKAFEMRSLLYLAAGDILNAASILIEHKEALFARVASDICYKNGFLTEAKKYEALCLKRCLMLQDYTVVKDLESKQNFEWIITIHKVLSKALESLDASEPVFGMQWKNIWKMKGSKVVVWKSYAMNNSNFFVYVFQALYENSPPDFKNDAFCNTFLHFKSEMSAPTNVVSSEELVVYATLYICDFFYILHTNNTKESFEKAFTALSKLLALCYSRRTVELLNKMCVLLPLDIVWDKELQKFEFEACIENSSEDIVLSACQHLVKRMVDKDLIKLVMDSSINQFNLYALTKELLDVNASDIVLVYFAINLVVNCIKNIENCFYYLNFRQIHLSHVVKHLLKCYHHEMSSKSSVHHSEITPVPNGDANQTSPTSAITNGHISDINDNDSDDAYVKLANKDEFKTVTLGNLTVTVIKDFPVANSDLEFANNSKHNKELVCEFCGTSSSSETPDSSQCSCVERFSFFFSLLNVIVKLTCKNVFKVNLYSKKKFLPKLRHIVKTENDGHPERANDCAQTIESGDNFENKELQNLFEAIDAVDQVQQFPDIYSMATFLKAFIRECENSCYCDGMKPKLQSLHKYIEEFVSC